MRDLSAKLFLRWVVIAFGGLLITATTVSAGVTGVIAVGLGGTEEYREMYEEAAFLTQKTVVPEPASNASASSSSTAGPATVLEGNEGHAAGEQTETTSAGETASADEGEEPAPVSGVSLMLENVTDKESLLKLIDQQIDFLLAEKEAGRTHRFILALFGHGSFDGENYKFNIKGPDITAQQLADTLERLDGIQQILMIATSASGAALPILEAPERVVITATKSGAESNAVQFPKFWTAALEGELSDSDHDELLTVGEAFGFAQEGVETFYENNQQLATEHARISGDATDAILSRLGSLRGTDNDEEINRMLAERMTLEQDFLAVKLTRGEIPQSRYLDDLEEVLLKIARLQKRMDELTGWVANGE